MVERAIYMERSDSRAPWSPRFESRLLFSIFRGNRKVSRKNQPKFGSVAREKKKMLQKGNSQKKTKDDVTQTKTKVEEGIKLFDK